MAGRCGGRPRFLNTWNRCLGFFELQLQCLAGPRPYHPKETSGSWRNQRKPTGSRTDSRSSGTAENSPPDHPVPSTVSTSSGTESRSSSTATNSQRDRNTPPHRPPPHLVPHCFAPLPLSCACCRDAAPRLGWGPLRCPPRILLLAHLYSSAHPLRILLLAPASLCPPTHMKTLLSLIHICISLPRVSHRAEPGTNQ